MTLTTGQRDRASGAAAVSSSIPARIRWVTVMGSESETVLKLSRQRRQ